MICTEKSDALFAESLKHIPGGVNSPVRAFRAVSGKPFFVDRAKGAQVWDVDGNEYVDYVGTWGPAIHGHAFEPIISAVREAATSGTSFGIPNPFEVEMAQLIKTFFPSIEKVRMVNSGTEACMSAIRVARGFTKRDKIIKFDGCYHGHHDSLLVKAGSGALTFGSPDSAGVPAEFTQHTIVIPFNDEAAVKKVFEANQGQIAGVILEPVIGNAGVILPKDGFLELLRELCSANDSLLIFDEVMTGFRVARGGTQERFGIKPDLTCLGKIIGGGLPVGAFGGRADVMSCLAPEGPVYQAGTLSGNPLAMAAGIAALKSLESGEAHEKLEALGAQLEEGMRGAAKEAGIPVTYQRCGSMFCGYFGNHTVHSLDDAMKCDRDQFAKYFHGMLQEGVYVAPSQFEAGFLSTAHGDAEIEKTVNAATKILKSL
ncbi:MAG: glutamate-1-semialdehyde-2,1-aminomutase [Verrucomicrobiales bacterium]|nr:glutamate-1-semialdehyde-2,1-aminomutase [Verrucomicrobiales bacterium]|tara:strand:+ start:2718 stop:4004 length:1287 start_codon:yes stop_codon:yes gene_type:complete